MRSAELDWGPAVRNGVKNPSLSTVCFSRLLFERPRDLLETGTALMWACVGVGRGGQGGLLPALLQSTQVATARG